MTLDLIDLSVKMIEEGKGTEIISVLSKCYRYTFSIYKQSDNCVLF